jgi:hypothetical protein
VTVLAADDRAYLSVAHPARYAFGDPAAPALVLNAVDSSGVMWVCEEPTGWDSPSVATPMDRKQYGHGAYAGEGYFEERPLGFAGAFAAPSAAAAQDARSRLLSVILGDLVNGVVYTHLDEPTPRSMILLPNGDPHVPFLDDRYATFAFTMIAADPFKYGPAATYGPARLPSATGNPGRRYPRIYPELYGSVGAVPTGGPITVPNPGDMPSEAVYRVTGPVPQPVITLSSGLFIGLSLDLAATDTLAVDTAAGTVTVNGVNRLDALRADSTLPLIPARTGVEVRLGSQTGGTDQAAGLLVTTAPTWK